MQASGEFVSESATEETERSLRHKAVVRITHWCMVTSVLGLMVSGGGILVSHPRLYWGETGVVGTPSLIDLPIPFIIGPSVWNRPIHFFFAWGLVFSALAYVIGGIVTRHFRKDLWPARANLTWNRIKSAMSGHARGIAAGEDGASGYNVVQRLIYLAVIFLLFPATLWTGLAMSFAVTSVVPGLATLLGGHQSARTLHFVFASLLVFYLILHLTMLCLAGFTSHVRAMITGYMPREERPL